MFDVSMFQWTSIKNKRHPHVSLQITSKIKNGKKKDKEGELKYSLIVGDHYCFVWRGDICFSGLFKGKKTLLMTKIFIEADVAI
jgi:hypothetical protein